MSRRSLTSAALMLALALGAAGCGSGNEPAATKTVTVTVEAPTHSSAPEPVAAPVTTESPVAPTPEASTTWTMPDLTGANLQDAQDTIQALTGNPLFYTGSSDATGRGRMQVNDSNWMVCSQFPAAGQSIDSATSINFSVVKYGELC